MTNEQAIQILKNMIGNQRIMTAEIYGAIDMAIEALSNTPNTFNTLEALGITDKQIDMAIGAIIYMLNNGYQSEDMEDALNSAIRVLAEVKMMFFKDRKELADKAEQWMEENHVAKTPLSVISYLEATGWLTDELSCSEKPNMSDTIYRQDALDEIQRFYGYLDEDMINRIHIGLNRLPSAQSELAINLQQTCNQLATDCISRQDAIDLVQIYLNPFMKYIGSPEDTECEAYARTILQNIVDNLRVGYKTPSAQTEIIRCKDCKWCEDADGLMCKNTASWVVATDYDFGCVCAERRQDG